MIKPHWCMQVLTTCTPQNAVFKGFSGLGGGRNHIPPEHQGVVDEVWHLSRPWRTGTCGTSQIEIGAGTVWNTWAETLRPNKQTKTKKTVTLGEKAPREAEGQWECAAGGGDLGSMEVPRHVTLAKIKKDTVRGARVTEHGAENVLRDGVDSRWFFEAERKELAEQQDSSYKRVTDWLGRSRFLETEGLGVVASRLHHENKQELFSSG